MKEEKRKKKGKKKKTLVRFNFNVDYAIALYFPACVENVHRNCNKINK